MHSSHNFSLLMTYVLNTLPGPGGETYALRHRPDPEVTQPNHLENDDTSTVCTGVEKMEAPLALKKRVGLISGTSLIVGTMIGQSKPQTPWCAQF